MVEMIFCRMKDTAGWQLRWTSPYMDDLVERVAINAKVLNPDNPKKMVAAAMGNFIQLWSVADDGSSREIGKG